MSLWKKTKAGKTHWQPRKPWHWIATRGSNNFFRGQKYCWEYTARDVRKKWRVVYDQLHHNAIFLPPWFLLKKEGCETRIFRNGGWHNCQLYWYLHLFSKKSFKTIFHRKRGGHSPLGPPPKFPHVEGWGAWKFSLFFVLGSNYFCWNFIFGSPLSPGPLNDSFQKLNDSSKNTTEQLIRHML